MSSLYAIVTTSNETINDCRVIVRAHSLTYLLKIAFHRKCLRHRDRAPADRSLHRPTENLGFHIGRNGIEVVDQSSHLWHMMYTHSCDHRIDIIWPSQRRYNNTGNCLVAQIYTHRYHRPQYITLRPIGDNIRPYRNVGNLTTMQSLFAPKIHIST